MKAGLGTAACTVNGVTVGALVAVNAAGDIIDPSSGRPIAGARSADGRALVGSAEALLRGEPMARWRPASATTLGIVATDASLTKPQANKLAQMAHDGLARSINPVHTPWDGDTVFALATGRGEPVADLTLLGVMAAEALARAVVRAAWAARALALPDMPALPAARDLAAREH
jgi:L-aminopeptidase/D-esterase-like protein